MVRSFLRNGRKHYGTSSSRERRDHARRQSCNTAIAGFARAAEQGTGHQHPKTVTKWRKRATVEDLKTGPKEPRSTVLTEAEEAMIVAFRRHTLLRLDDCLYALKPSIPRLTRSALLRCLQAWYLALAGCRGRQTKAAAVQAIPYRLLPYRHRQGSDGGGQALSLCGY